MKNLNINWLFWLQALLFLGAVFILHNIIAGSSAIFAGLGNFLRIISPVIVGFVIAYLLSGACTLFERLIKKNITKTFVEKRARGLSVMIVYLLVVLLLYLVGSFLFPIIIQNINDFIHFSLPMIYIQAREWVMNVDWGGLSEMLSLEEQLQSFFDNFSLADVMEHAQFGVYQVTEFVVNITSGIFNAVIAIIISIYASLHKNKLLDMFNRVMNIFVKEPRLTQIRSYLTLANQLFYKFIKAQFLDACILGILATILLTVIGVPYAVVLGLFLGVCNMIPQFGSIFGTIVTIAFTFITGTPTQALMVAAFLTILQQIDANVISPKIMGNALKINPILIISSLVVGGAYFGVIGMFLSIPIAAMLKILFIDALEKKEGRSGVVGNGKHNDVYEDDFEEGDFEEDDFEEKDRIDDSGEEGTTNYDNEENGVDEKSTVENNSADNATEEDTEEKNTE